MPWEVPITVDDMEYPVTFDGDDPPSQADLDEAVNQILAQSGDAGQGRLSSAGSSFGRGAAKTVTGTGKELSRLMLDSPMMPQGQIKYLVDKSMEAVTGIPSEMMKEASRAAIEKEYPGFGELLTSPGEAIAKKIEGAEASIDEALPVNPAYQGEWMADKIPGVLGQAVGQLGTMAAGGAVTKAPKVVQALGLGQAALLGRGSGREEAERLGVEGIEAELLASAYGAAEAGVEMLGGVGSKDFSKALTGEIYDLFKGAATKKFAKTVGSEIVEEPITGELQDIASSVAATEDPNNPGRTYEGEIIPDPSLLNPETLARRAEEAALGGIGGLVFAGAEGLMTQRPKLQQAIPLYAKTRAHIQQLEAKGEEVPEDLRERATQLSAYVEANGALASLDYADSVIAANDPDISPELKAELEAKIAAHEEAVPTASAIKEQILADPEAYAQSREEVLAAAEFVLEGDDPSQADLDSVNSVISQLDANPIVRDASPLSGRKFDAVAAVQKETAQEAEIEKIAINAAEVGPDTVNAVNAVLDQQAQAEVSSQIETPESPFPQAPTATSSSPIAEAAATIAGKTAPSRTLQKIIPTQASEGSLPKYTGRTAFRLADPGSPRQKPELEQAKKLVERVMGKKAKALTEGSGRGEVTYLTTDQVASLPQTELSEDDRQKVLSGNAEAFVGSTGRVYVIPERVFIYRNEIKAARKFGVSPQAVALARILLHENAHTVTNELLQWSLNLSEESWEKANPEEAKLAREFKSLMADAPKEAMRSTAKRYGIKGADSPDWTPSSMAPDEQIRIMLEYFSIEAEKNSRILAGDFSQTGENKSFLKRIWEFLKRLYNYAVGASPDAEVSPNEIAKFLRRAQDLMAKDGFRGGGTEAMFSLPETSPKKPVTKSRKPTSKADETSNSAQTNSVLDSRRVAGSTARELSDRLGALWKAASREVGPAIAAAPERIYEQVRTFGEWLNENGYPPIDVPKDFQISPIRMGDRIIALARGPYKELGSGIEGVVIQDSSEADVLYKVFVPFDQPNEEGMAIAPTFQIKGGKSISDPYLFVGQYIGNVLSPIQKANVITSVGGLPMEFTGMDEDGYMVFKMPRGTPRPNPEVRSEGRLLQKYPGVNLLRLSPKEQEEFNQILGEEDERDEADFGEMLEKAGLYQVEGEEGVMLRPNIAENGAYLGVVDGVPYLLTDIRSANVLEDNQQKLRISDAAVAELTPDILEKVPKLKKAVEIITARESKRKKPRSEAQFSLPITNEIPERETPDRGRGKRRGGRDLRSVQRKELVPKALNVLRGALTQGEEAFRTGVDQVAQAFGTNLDWNGKGSPSFSTDQSGNISLSLSPDTRSRLLGMTEENQEIWMHQLASELFAYDSASCAYKDIQKDKPTDFRRFLSELYDDLRIQNLYGAEVKSLYDRLMRDGVFSQKDVGDVLMRYGWPAINNSTPRRIQTLRRVLELKSRQPSTRTAANEWLNELDQIETRRNASREALSTLLMPAHEREITEQNLSSVLGAATKYIANVFRNKPEKIGAQRNTANQIDAKGRMMLFGISRLFGGEAVMEGFPLVVQQRVRDRFSDFFYSAKRGDLGQNWQRVANAMDSYGEPVTYAQEAREEARKEAQKVARKEVDLKETKAPEKSLGVKPVEIGQPLFQPVVETINPEAVPVGREEIPVGREVQTLPEEGGPSAIKDFLEEASRYPGEQLDDLNDELGITDLARLIVRMSGKEKKIKPVIQRQFSVPIPAAASRYDRTAWTDNNMAEWLEQVDPEKFGELVQFEQFMGVRTPNKYLREGVADMAEWVNNRLINIVDTEDGSTKLNPRTGQVEELPPLDEEHVVAYIKLAKDLLNKKTTSRKIQKDFQSWHKDTVRQQVNRRRSRTAIDAETGEPERITQEWLENRDYAVHKGGAVVAVLQLELMNIAQRLVLSMDLKGKKPGTPEYNREIRKMELYQLLEPAANDTIIGDYMTVRDAARALQVRSLAVQGKGFWRAMKLINRARDEAAKEAAKKNGLTPTEVNQLMQDVSLDTILSKLGVQLDKDPVYSRLEDLVEKAQESRKTQAEAESNQEFDWWKAAVATFAEQERVLLNEFEGLMRQIAERATRIKDAPNQASIPEGESELSQEGLKKRQEEDKAKALEILRKLFAMQEQHGSHTPKKVREKALSKTNQKLLTPDSQAQKIIDKVLGAPKEKAVRERKPNPVRDAFAQQVKKPVSDGDFSLKLQKLGVSKDVADRLAEAARSKIEEKEVREQELEANVSEDIAKDIIDRIDKQFTEWVPEDTKQANEVTRIKRAALVDARTTATDVGNLSRERFVQQYQKDLEDAGVTPGTANALASRLYQENIKLAANKQDRRRAKMVKSRKFLNSLVQSIFNSPASVQNRESFAKDQAEDAFRMLGLTQEDAEIAAKALTNSVIKAQKEAQDIALTESAKKLRLKKPTVDNMRRALRAGLFNPANPIASALAKEAGFKELSYEDHQKMAAYDDMMRGTSSEAAYAQKKMLDIMIKSSPPKSIGEMMAQAWVSDAISGTSNLLLNLTSPAFTALRNGVTQMTDIAIGAVKGETDFEQTAKLIGQTFRSIKRGADEALTQLKFSARHDSYKSRMAEYIKEEYSLAGEIRNGMNEFREGIAQRSPKRTALGLLRSFYGTTDYIRRTFSALDQAWSSGLSRQNFENESMRFMLREAGITPEEADVIMAESEAAADEVLQKVREQWDNGPIGSMDPAMEAAVRHDLFQEALLQRMALQTGMLDRVAEIPTMSQKEGDLEIGNRGSESAPLWDVFNNAIEGVKRAAIAMRNEPGADKKRNAFVDLLGRVLTGFISVPANVLNRGFYYTPVGILRAKSKLKEFSKGELTSHYKETMATKRQAEIRLIEGMIGTIFMLAYAALKAATDEDDKWGINLTGAGPMDPKLRDAWLKQGHRQNSLELKTPFGFASIPYGRGGFEGVAPLLTPLGAVDDMRLNGIDPEKAENFGRYLSALANASSSQAKFFGLKEAAGFAAPSEKQAIGGITYAASPLFPYSGFIKGLLKAFGEDSPLEKSSPKGAFIASTPVAGVAGTARVNALGDQMDDIRWLNRAWFAGVPLSWSSGQSPSNDELYSYILRTGIGPSIPNRSGMERANGPLSDEQWMRYAKTRGRLMKEEMKRGLPKLTRLPREEAEDLMSRISSEATMRAKKQLGLK